MKLRAPIRLMEAHGRRRRHPWPARPSACYPWAMADDDNIRDFVHERFNRLDAKLDRILAAQDTTNQRLSSLETRVTSLEASIVHVQERMDGIQRQLDNVGQRLGHIERRLELTDAPTQSP